MSKNEGLIFFIDQLVNLTSTTLFFGALDTTNPYRNTVNLEKMLKGSVNFKQNFKPPRILNNNYISKNEGLIFFIDQLVNLKNMTHLPPLRPRLAHLTSPQTAHTLSAIHVLQCAGAGHWTVSTGRKYTDGAAVTVATLLLCKATSRALSRVVVRDSFIITRQLSLRYFSNNTEIPAVRGRLLQPDTRTTQEFARETGC